MRAIQAAAGTMQGRFCTPTSGVLPDRLTAITTARPDATSVPTKLMPLIGKQRDFRFQQYIDFLDREPDAGEVSGWVNALDSGLSRADLIEAFMNSGEFRFEGKFIAQSYLGILTRDADHAGFRGWLGALLAGVSREQIVQVFLDSGEFQSRFGSNLTNGQFVETDVQ